MSCGGMLWGSVALSLGLWWQSIIPFGYTLATVLNLAFLYRTKRFRIVRNFQVSISVLLPFLFQWGLGGLVPSGGTMLWSLLSLNASQSFGTLNTSLRWLAMFLMLVVVSTIIDPMLPVPDILESLEFAPQLFAMNMIAVSLAIFALISYFLHLQRQTSIALAERNREIEDSQRALVQSEKMAALGRLSAGMAHELNNPATAAARGSQHLKESIKNGWKASIELGLLDLDQSQADLLAELENVVERQLYGPTSYDAITRSDLENQIEDWCESAGITNAPDSALMLESGLSPDLLARHESVLSGQHLSKILNLVTGLYEQESLAEQVAQGTHRISVLVNALKSYTYMDQTERQPTDVNAGINDTLIMLQGALKHGVVVERELYEDLPCIDANAGELNQVWTNLIDNAVAAMDGRGRLHIQTMQDGNEIVVNFTDDGSGIPADLIETIFDPFVTTKPVGKGTGLGLNISQNIIVDKHQGTISVESKPGRTCFSIRLPLVEIDCPPGVTQQEKS
jgi:signal transduction histidine kinase